MSDSLKSLQAQLEAVQKKASKAEGARALLLEQLQTRHGCDSVREGKKKRAELKAQDEALDAKYRKILKRWKARYGKLLEESS